MIEPKYNISQPNRTMKEEKTKKDLEDLYEVIATRQSEGKLVSHLWNQIRERRGPEK